MKLSVPQPCTPSRLLAICEWLQQHRGEFTMWLVDANLEYTYTVEQLLDRARRKMKYDRDTGLPVAWETVFFFDLEITFHSDDLGMEYFLRFL